MMILFVVYLGLDEVSDRSMKELDWIKDVH